MVVQEVVQTVTGLLCVHLLGGVVHRLVHGVETLQWLLTNLVGLVTGIVTVLVQFNIPVNLELHSLE